MNTVAKLVRIVLVGLAFLIFWAGGAILSWTVLPLVGLRYRNELQRTRACRGFVSHSFRAFLHSANFLGLINFDIDDLRGQLPEGPYVLVANHPTLLDTVLLLGAHPGLVAVAKGAIYHGPFVGRLLRLCGHIDAGDGSPMAGAAVVVAAQKHLEAGDPMLIFPEGTRSPSESLNPFKSGAFLIAAQARVPVVPVALRCEPRGLMKDQPWYRVPDRTMTFTASVLPGVSTVVYGADARRLKGDVRRLIERQLELDVATHEELPALAMT